MFKHEIIDNDDEDNEDIDEDDDMNAEKTFLNPSQPAESDSSKSNAEPLKCDMCDINLSIMCDLINHKEKTKNVTVKV